MGSRSTIAAARQKLSSAREGPAAHNNLCLEAVMVLLDPTLRISSLANLVPEPYLARRP